MIGQEISLLLKENLACVWYLSVIIGIYILSSRLVHVVYFLYTTLFRRRLNLINQYGRSSYALVTGSSEGIGRQMALQFAKEGFNVVLVARREQKLKEVKEEINTLYPDRDVKYIAADLVEQSYNSMKKVLKQLNGLDVSILVNNAGVDVCQSYEKQTIPQIINLIRLNCYAPVILTHLLLPQLLRRSSRSCVLNVGSIASELPLPFYNVYSASKAYLKQLTLSVSVEEPNLDWLLLKPGEVSTQMTAFKAEDLFTIHPKQCVGGTFDKLGQQTQTYGFWRHAIQQSISLLLPEKVFIWIFLTFFIDKIRKSRAQFAQIQRKKALK